MKISIAVNGHFHALQLARQIDKRHSLEQIITTYPKSYTRKYDIPDSRVTSFLSQELLKRLFMRFDKFSEMLHVDVSFSSRFDRLAAKVLKQSDIFVGFSSSVTQTLQKAKSMGSITVIERGSAHILAQKKILSEEYGIQGIQSKDGIHPQCIDNELREYESVDYISIPSEFVMQSFVDHGIPKEKLIITPYGTNLPVLKKLAEKSNDFTVVFCGLCSYQKGVQYLLQAFDELNLPHSKCYIIGTVAPESNALRKKYERDNIIFTGSLSKDKIIPLFSSAHLFCLPSLQDGMGMVVLEAMACGLPVICSENTGAKDVVEENKNGWVIPIRSVSAIKEKIVILYEDSTTNLAMGEYARSTAQKSLSWDLYGDRMMAHYEMMLNSR